MSRMMISTTIKRQKSVYDKYGFAWYITEYNPSFLAVMRIK